ncbi:MAG: DUF454 family protein [Bdellovibrionales bacterium]|nr:DUF454 family protein [Bdellovibrionales bacterium]
MTLHGLEPVASLSDFLALARGQRAFLFLTEEGCRHCLAAEPELADGTFADGYADAVLRRLRIDDDPAAVAELGLVGVPAFLVLDGRGGKRLKTGFSGREDLRGFVESVWGAPTSAPARIANPYLRTAVFSVGCVSLALGILGAFLPLLPTTPFVLLSAACFVRSSEKAHAWIRRQPLLGKALADWERNRAISPRTKIVAVALIAVSLVGIWARVDRLELKLAVSSLLVGVSAFIATRKSS